MDPSYPEGASVNDFIDKEEFSLKYITVDRAIDFILELRIIPVSPRNFNF